MFAAIMGCTAVIVVAASAAGAQSTTADQARVDELGLSLTVGFDGQTQDGAWQPVTVGIEPARPVAGHLSVVARSASMRETQVIEVAAGSRKVYRFLVPPGPVSVTLAEDGADPVTVRQRLVDGSRTFLVGVLGGAASPLPALRSDITGQVGTWVAVDPAWLELSAQSLESLGTLVAAAADLEGLAPTARRNLAAAVAAGAQLVVVGAGDIDLRALGLPWDPPEQPWQLAASDVGLDDVTAGPLVTAVPAGHGRILLTAVAPGDAGAGRSGDLWSTLAQPSRHATATMGDYRVTAVAYQFSRLLAEEGSDVPALPGLGLFVVVYVFVVGPVNALLLARMGRRELAWATVPLITVIFTGGAFLGATSARPPSGGAARLAYWTDGAATELVAAGVRAPTPGRQTVTLPGTSWTVRALVDGAGDVAVARGEDTSVAMNLTSLQLGGVAAWRTTDAPAPLDIEAAPARAGGLEVTVTNTSGGDLDDLVVRAATATRGIPQLAAGETATVSLGGADLPEASAYRDPFEQLPMTANGAVTPPLSLRAVVNSEVADGRPGMVWVSAIDEGASIPTVAANGAAVRDRGTMIAVGEHLPAPADGRASPFTVGREAFVVTSGASRIGPEAFEGSGPVFLRYQVPAGTDLTSLSNQLRRSNQSDGPAVDVTVWDPQKREWVEPEEVLGAAGQAIVSPLGEVWVRATGDMYPFEYSARTIAGGAP